MWYVFLQEFATLGCRLQDLDDLLLQDPGFATQSMGIIDKVKCFLQSAGEVYDLLVSFVLI